MCVCVHCLSVVSRSISNDVEDSPDHDVEAAKKVTKKPSAEKAAAGAPVKLVPAPPPKENIWEKRKSENQASRQQQSSASAESTDRESTAADIAAQSKTSSESVSSSSHGEETPTAEKVCYVHCTIHICEDVKTCQTLLSNLTFCNEFKFHL